MFSSLAEYRDHQIGRAVDNLRMVTKARDRVNETSKTHDGSHTLEIAVQCGVDLRKQIDRTNTGRSLPLFERDVRT